MQIHELNNYTGELGGNAYAVVDNGNDTGKVSIPVLLKDATDAIADVNARVDNIIAGGDAPSEAEIIDARHGVSGANYPSLGDAIRTQVGNIENELYGGTIIKYLADVDLAVGYITSGGAYNSNSGYRYGYLDIRRATSASLIIASLSEASSVVINMCDANKNYKRNLYNWVGDGTYDFSSFQNGDGYLCISCKTADTSHIKLSAVFPDGVIDEIDDQISDAVSEIDSKMPLAKMYGGTMVRKLSDVVYGKYVNNTGTEVSSAAWCYGYVDITDAERVVVDQTGISDTTIINYVDKNKAHLSNIGTWIATNTDLYGIPYTAKYLCISCKKVDEPILSVEVHPNAEIKTIEKNTDDSYRYDSAAAYVRTRTPNFIKGVHLDCGRKYFSVANIKLMIDAMYDAGLNALELYFSDDNGFRFGLDDMDIVVDGKTYDLSPILGDGAAPTDGSNKWLTQSEMDDIIEYANSKGIEIIPALNMPAHMSAIREVFPVNSLNLRAAYGLGGEHGVKFMLAIIKKYADYFVSRGSRYYNICSDETEAVPADDFAMFIPRACKQITECHLTPMVYNDNVCKYGYFDPYINTGAVVLGWIKRSGQAPYSQIDNCGYRMINCASNNYFYWTLGTTVTTTALLNNIRNMNIFLMADGSIMRNIKGAMYHIWCDQADLDGADDGDNVTSQVIPCIAAFGEAVAKYVPEDLVPMEQNVQTIEDIESMKNGGGLILRSANGTKYKLTIGNDGAIAVNSME